MPGWEVEVESEHVRSTACVHSMSLSSKKHGHASCMGCIYEYSYTCKVTSSVVQLAEDIFWNILISLSKQYQIHKSDGCSSISKDVLRLLGVVFTLPSPLASGVGTAVILISTSCFAAPIGSFPLLEDLTSSPLGMLVLDIIRRSPHNSTHCPSGSRRRSIQSKASP